MSEKKREPNFSAEEKMHLLSIIVSTYGNILEDKKTDRASVALKNETWKKIEKEFNSSSPSSIYRSAEALKLLYENKKKELRRKAAEEKKQTFLTGGGPMTSIKFDPLEELLLSIVSEKSIYGLHNKFDSNGETNTQFNLQKSTNQENEYVCELNQSLQFEEEEIVIPEENATLSGSAKRKSNGIDSQTCNIAKQSWKKFKGDDLQLPITPELKVIKERNEGQTPKSNRAGRRRPTQTVRALTASDVAMKYNLLLDKRLILINKQIQSHDEDQMFLKQERKLKLDLLKWQIAAEKAKISQSDKTGADRLKIKQNFSRYFDDATDQ